METAITEAPVQALEKEGPVWIEALPARTYKTPFYGDVPITPDKLQNFVKNFKENVRGQEIPLDFEHGEDKAKGHKAAGWFKDVKVDRSSSDPTQFSLWVQAELTNEARNEVKDNQWKYVSLDWHDEWEDNDGNKFSDVIASLGLTNKPIAKKTMPINFSENMWKELDDDSKKVFADIVIERLNESKEWEHSEPGTGSPPEPRTDEDGSDDPAIEGGWRIETPPAEGTPQDKSKGGKEVPEYAFSEKSAHELLSVLELPGDAKPDEVVTKLKTVVGDLTELKKNQNATEQEKKFAEQYPDFWNEHNLLMKKNRENEAIRFSESVKPVRKQEGMGLKTTNEGLSTMALEKIQEVHKKFAEGKATQDDFEDCIKTIMNGGIVKFGELGSNQNEDDVPEIDATTATGVQQARKLFSELVSKTQAEHPDWEFKKALEETGKKHPDLAAAYRQALPA